MRVGSISALALAVALVSIDLSSTHIWCVCVHVCMCYRSYPGLAKRKMFIHRIGDRIDWMPISFAEIYR